MEQRPGAMLAQEKVQQLLDRVRENVADVTALSSAVEPPRCA